MQFLAHEEISLAVCIFGLLPSYPHAFSCVCSLVVVSVRTSQYSMSISPKGEKVTAKVHAGQ
jgi:hypothetical protein